MRYLCLLLVAVAVAVAVALPLQCQPAPPYVPEGKTVKISDHVWMIPDGRVNLVPNIGIVVGSKATLVIDSGMGPRNGEVVLHELRKVSTNTELYLTTTHYHPEHVTGFQVFPASAKLIRPAVQEEEAVSGTQQMITNFSRLSPVHAELLKDVKHRVPDIVFDSSLEIDLGGVTARLFTLGPAHTRGDNFIYVKEDGVLFTGDVVTNRFFPIINSSGTNWLSILDKLAAIKPRIVVPGHGEIDDAAILGRESVFFKDLLARTAELKKQDKSADETAKALAEEFRVKYSTWENPGLLTMGVKKLYGEVE